jgi:penicillin-binding protein A
LPERATPDARAASSTMSTQAQTTLRSRSEPPWRARRRRLIRRATIVAGVVVAVFLVVLAISALFSESEVEQAAERFGEAWSNEDYGAMYDMLDGDSRDELDEEEFSDAYEEAAAIATVLTMTPDDASEESDEVLLPVTASTEAFGTITGDIRMIASEDGDIAWEPHMVFPGLREDEELSRRTTAPERAPLLARDGTVLAEGDPDDRTTELDADAGSVAGTIAPASTRDQRDSVFERGFPEETMIGTSGLELIFERELAGTPGGVLRAGDREIASTEPTPGAAVRTTIDPDLHEAAAVALGRLGGIVAIDVGSGEVRAIVGGTATTAQPPGSTFKIVTTTAALEDDLVTPSTEFPVENAALIDGVTIDNAGQASCGGTFTVSFAESCNSVFAPLGVDVGAERLVETAERFGVNQPPTIPGVDESTIPQPDEFESDLEVGATAIGQGRLLMTPVGLAAVSQAIANNGILIEPTLDPDEPPERRRITTRSVANTIEDLMVGVTAGGATGENAAIEGVDVAGKTGTAELGEGVLEHAWFTAFAPAGERPELAVAVMVANGGSGGQVAAPVAKTVLEAGL